MDYKLASILYRVSKMLMSLLEEEYGVGKKAPDRPRAVNHS